MRKDTARSTDRARRLTTRIAAVFCLLLAIGMLPVAAFAAPITMSDVEATYLNTATINLMATDSVKTYSQLDENAAVEDKTVTTSVYGAHILRFWSTDAAGNVEATITAPFFVDEDVLPEVRSDAKASYSGTAAIKVTATDNFNGSGVDYLCYRVDGGKIVTAIAPARVLANKVLLAKIAAIAVSAAVGPPDITPTTQPPAGHYGANCATCHTVVIPTPEPTSTPEPTGTPAPLDGVSANVVVAGAGTHKIEYWAQDIARNTTAYVTKTFAVTPITTVKTVSRTGIRLSASSVYYGRRIFLTGTIQPNASGQRVTLQRRRSTGTWVNLTRSPVSLNAASVYYFAFSTTPRGTWYFRTIYAGSPTVARSVSSSLKLVVR